MEFQRSSVTGRTKAENRRPGGATLIGKSLYRHAKILSDALYDCFGLID